MDAVGPVEILIGVPALNHARSVNPVLGALIEGVERSFPTRKTAVLVADAGSQDGTLEAVRAWRETATSITAVRGVRLTGPPQRGRAILTLVAAARRLAVRGVLLVDADLIGVGPEWVERLLDPVLREEAAYVSPAYTRTALEGTLTTNLLAPLARALYGKRLQQLVGGCAGLSAGLLSRLVESNGWDRVLAAHGVEIRLVTEALVSGHTIAETHLGPKRVDAGPGQPDLATTLAGVVGPIFQLMERYRAVWQEVRGSVPVIHRGDPPALHGVGEVPVDRMVRAFRLGLKDLLPVWEQILLDETLGHLYPLGVLAADEFRFPVSLWARVVSDFAVAHHERRVAPDHLLRALTPLYLGRVAAFLFEAQTALSGGRPAILDTIDHAFEAEKEYLTARWR